MEVTCRYCGERVHVKSADAVRYVAREGNAAEPASSLIVESRVRGDRLVHRCVAKTGTGAKWSAVSTSGGAQ